MLDVESLTDTTTCVSELGRRTQALNLDLQRLTPDAANEVIETCVKTLGRLDILVNNAGIIRRAPALEFGACDWDEVLGVNLTAAFHLSQAAARYYVSEGRGGKIINIASLLSFQGGVHVPAYTAAKSGLAGLTRALANEWAGQNSNVNTIAPGYMETQVTAELRDDPERSRQLLDRIPAGRWGTPDDIKGVAVLLASPAGSYLYGAILPVDGGWLTR